MIGFRCLLASPRPAILFLAFFVLTYLTKREISVESIGLGVVLGAALALCIAVACGRAAWLVFLFSTCLYLVLGGGYIGAELFGWDGIFPRFGASILILVLLIVGLRMEVALPLTLRARMVVAVSRAHAFGQAIPHVTSTYWKPHARRIEALAGERARFKQFWTVRFLPEGNFQTFDVSDVVHNERFTKSLVAGAEGNSRATTHKSLTQMRTATSLRAAA